MMIIQVDSRIGWGDEMSHVRKHSQLGVRKQRVRSCVVTPALNLVSVDS